MLPAVATFQRTASEILVYTRAAGRGLAAAGAGRPPRGLYLVSASVLGLVFIGLSVRLWMRATPKAAMRLFSYSITYLTLLFVLHGGRRLLQALTDTPDAAPAPTRRCRRAEHRRGRPIASVRCSSGA